VKLLLLHGLESTPGGSKSDYLAAKGCSMVNPALPKESWDRSLAIAQKAFDDEQPDVVVGSSRGGALAMNLRSGATRLVLIAPGWKRFGPATRVKQGTWILHSEKDDVIPIDASRELARVSLLPAEALIVVGVDHRMKDPTALDALWKALSTPGTAPRPVTLCPRCGSAEFRDVHCPYCGWQA
jgi:hypothetical protein